MQFTDQVDWSFGDFLVMAGLLFSLTMAVAVVRQKVREKTQRIGLIALLLLIFLLIWAELAVGIFGTFLAGSWSDHDQKRAALLCHKLRQQSVEMGNTSGDQVMQFVLPSDYTTENTPLAKDNKVQVLESESGHYIAIQYGGYTRSSREKTAAQQLQAIAQKYNLKLTGKPILMVYNSPFQVFNRKNEVLYKVVLQ